MSIRKKMSINKIAHINIVTYSCSIERIIIITKHPYLLSFSTCYIEYIWQEIVRNTIWNFSNISWRMCTNRIEISQVHHSPICMLCIIFKKFFNNEFCGSIRISRSKRHIFTKWWSIIRAVYCCRRRKYNLVYSKILHNSKKCDASSNIIRMIEPYFLTALPYYLQSCKMDHPIKTIFFKNIL